MRKISASYIFPGNQPPLKKGILICDNDGKIIDLIDTKGKLNEEAGLEYYNGIITPGFVNTYCHLELSHLKGKRNVDNTWFTLCPNPNLFIESWLHPVSLIKKHNQNICLGTGSLASNQQSSILSKMITLQQYFPEISLEKLIKWGTLSGARALHIEKNPGSLEPGKKPGVNLITGIDLKNMKLTVKSKVRRLI